MDSLYSTINMIFFPAGILGSWIRITSVAIVRILHSAKYLYLSLTYADT
jgi:hypothetical protein